jgi:hypothetical protein
MKFLLALLALTPLHREMMALNNAYHTLHDQGVYGVVLTCEEIKVPFFRCVNEQQNLLMYCPYLQDYKCQVYKIPAPVVSEADGAAL